MHKKIIKSLLLVIPLFLISTQAFAYILYSGGYNSYVIKFQNSNLNSYYSSALADAVSSWNGTATKAAISEDSTSANLVYGGNWATTWYGQYSGSSHNSSGQATQFDIRINAERIFQDVVNGITIVYTPRSTFTHEFGHALHLDDLSSGSAVMNTNRTRETIYNPLYDDINGVNAYW
ncbi:hypothetical protein D3C76_425720 [compost metagenome]